MTISPAWAYTADHGGHLIAAPPAWLPDEWDTQVDADRQPRDTATGLADLVARDGYDHPAPSTPRPDLRVVA